MTSVAEISIVIPPNSTTIIPGTGLQVSHNSPDSQMAYAIGNVVRLPGLSGHDWFAKMVSG